MTKYDPTQLYTDNVGKVGEAAQKSRSPISLDVVFDLASQYGANGGSLVLDVGCASGNKSRELLARTGCRIEGVELAEHLVRLGKEENKKAGVGDKFSIQQGSIYDLPFAKNHFDFIFCRDMICLVKDVDRALAECRRVLKTNKFMLVYVTLSTDLLYPKEQKELEEVLGAVSLSKSKMENAIKKKFQITKKIVIGSQGRQHMEENGDHATTQKLLAIARMLTWKEEFINEFGEQDYDFALADSKWGVYQMLGKLEPTVYVLQNTGAQKHLP